MKAKLYDRIKTLVDVKGDLSSRTYPAGTIGTVVDCYERPVEGYAVDIATPDETSVTGFSYDNIVVYAEDIVVLKPDEC